MASVQFETWLKADFEAQSDDDWEMIAAAAQQVFTPAAPIDANSLFAGRMDQIRHVLGVVQQKGAHAIIYGERGVGKSSLANIIKDRVDAADKFTKVMKISCSPNDSFATVWGNLFFDYKFDGKEVAAAIAERPQPFTVFKVAEVLPREFKHICILDEFDRIQDEQTKTLIADTIKYLSDNPTNMTVLIVGVGKSVTTLFGRHPSIQRCCSQIHMPRMTSEELKQIIDETYPKLSMRIDAEALELIVKFSKGFPGYAHLLGMLSVQAAVEALTQQVSTAHVNRAVANALERADESTRSEYYSAVQSTKPENRYKQVLLACALARKNERGQFSASDVCEQNSQIMGRNMVTASLSRHLNAFCCADRGPVLTRVGKPKRYMYYFCNPILEPLVAMIGVAA